MPCPGGEHSLAFDKENLMSFRISVLQRPVLTIEMIVKKEDGFT